MYFILLNKKNDCQPRTIKNSGTLVKENVENISIFVMTSDFQNNLFTLVSEMQFKATKRMTQKLHHNFLNKIPCFVLGLTIL